MKIILTIAIALVTLLLGITLFVVSGRYNMGADSPHATLTSRMIATLRDRSIAWHSGDVQVPNLTDPALVLKGTGHYAAMCVGCHLAPGVTDSEIRPGLYPQPPNLSRVRVDPRAAFWVIKHGIKMSAMPAWGATHDDATIWSMVALVQRLPDLDAEQYKRLVSQAPPDEDMEMDMGHGGTDSAH